MGLYVALLMLKMIFQTSFNKHVTDNGKLCPSKIPHIPNEVISKISHFRCMNFCFIRFSIDVGLTLTFLMNPYHFDKMSFFYRRLMWFLNTTNNTAMSKFQHTHTHKTSIVDRTQFMWQLHGCGIVLLSNVKDAFGEMIHQ